MGDAVDVTGENTLVFCFGFIFSKKHWAHLGKALRLTYRRVFRYLRVMESFSDDLV
jgi:hypothetical protein